MALVVCLGVLVIFVSGILVGNYLIVLTKCNCFMGSLGINGYCCKYFLTLVSSDRGFYIA